MNTANPLYHKVFPLALVTLLLTLGMVSQARAEPCTIYTDQQTKTLNLTKTGRVGEDMQTASNVPFTPDIVANNADISCPSAQDVYVRMRQGSNLPERSAQAGTYWLNDAHTLYIELYWVLPNGTTQAAESSKTISNGYPSGRSAGPSLQAKIYTETPVNKGLYIINKTVRVEYLIKDPADSTGNYTTINTTVINIEQVNISGWSCDPDPTNATQDLGIAVLDLSSAPTTNDGQTVYTATRASSTSNLGPQITSFGITLKNCNVGEFDQYSGYTSHIYWDVYATNVSPTDNTLLLPNSSSTTKGLGFRFRVNSKWLDLRQIATPLGSDYDGAIHNPTPGDHTIYIYPYIAPTGDVPPEPGVLNGTIFFRVEYY